MSKMFQEEYSYNTCAPAQLSVRVKASELTHDTYGNACHSFTATCWRTNAPTDILAKGEGSSAQIALSAMQSELRLLEDNIREIVALEI